MCTLLALTRACSGSRLLDPYAVRVKLGVDVRTGETVAVKIMYKDNMSARAAQQLRREITSMKALNHPNVLRLKDVHEVGTLHTYKLQIRSDMLQMQDAHQGKRYLGREDAFKI